MRIQYIDSIRSLPHLLRKEVTELSDAQLDTPYREHGWTVRQVIHHLVDSHMNAVIRMKLILSENHPTLKPYDQEKWAEFDDTRIMPIESSLKILDGLQERMAYILEHAADEDFKRTAHHPEVGEITLEDLLETYGKHGDNHLAQITALKTSKGW